MGFFVKLYSVWTWCCFSELDLEQLCDYSMVSFLLFLFLAIQKQYEGSFSRFGMCYSNETGFITSAWNIWEWRIQFWLKSLKVWHLCFIYHMNYETSSLSSLFYFEDYIWNRVTFMRSLLVGMFVWIDPQNLWPARHLNWPWGLAFIRT